MNIEIAIFNSKTEKVKYVLIRDCHSMEECDNEFQRIIKLCVKDKHSDFFYGCEPKDFSYSIQDIG